MVMKQDLVKFLDKRIKIFLSNGHLYHCTIEKINEHTTLIIDKFSEKHLLVNSHIVEIEEVNQ